jgi:hypothetical protein
MTVNFDGAKSGNRKDGLAPVPSSGVAQPVEITTTNAPTSIKFPTCKSTSPESSRRNADMPTGGTNPTDSNAT